MFDLTYTFVGGALTINAENDASGLFASETIDVRQSGSTLTMYYYNTPLVPTFTGVTSMTINGFAGTDWITVDTSVSSSIAVTLNGGSGPDRLIGGNGNDVVNGGDGADTIDARGGADTISGGNNDDVLYAGTGNGDVFNGGAGVDLVDYSGVTGTNINLNVSLDGVPNDGLTFGGSEGDNVKTDVERISGGGGNDTLTGSSAANFIWGNGGNDVITGNGGADTLLGGDGDDTIYARDSVVDIIDGGNGTDSLQKDNNDNVTSVEVLLP